MTSPRVKICCISSVAEAKQAIDHGATAIGLVGPMPSGPGVIDDDTIRQITKQVSAPISTFLLTSSTKTDDIITQHRRVQTTTIQLVDELPLHDYEVLRRELPHISLVQVIHVLDHSSVQQAKDVAQYVDAILLDSGNPKLAIKELGGTGRTHDWNLSRRIRDSVLVPVYLAGGLHKDNVREAISTVQPYGVDVCSGVRTSGKLDAQKLKDFCSAVRSVSR